MSEDMTGQFSDDGSPMKLKIIPDVYSDGGDCNLDDDLNDINESFMSSQAFSY